MNSSDTGYVCKEATYFNYYKNKEDTMCIDGNYYVIAGDENFLIAFYKGIFHVIHNNRIIYSGYDIQFLSETFYFEGFPTLKVEHLDKNVYIDPLESLGTWEEYIKTR